MSGKTPIDPGQRRGALLGLVALTLLGAAALFGIRGWLDGLATAEPAAAIRSLSLALWLMVGLIALLLAGTAAWIWRVASQAQAAQRFPPPGVAVIGRVPILTGAAALKRARLLRLIAGFLGLMALVVPATMSVIVNALLRGAAS